jgi:hypothetical protein
MKANVRNAPDCTNDSAVSPPGLMISVLVRNTMAAKGTRMMAIVLNWRFR